MEIKRTYFENDSNIPTFELSNGDIKKPRLNAYGAIQWMTDEEFEKHKKETSDNSPSILKTFFNFFKNAGKF